MNTALALLCSFVFSFTFAQELNEIASITENDAVIQYFRIQKTSNPDRYYLFVFKEGGRLKVYDSQRNPVYEMKDVDLFVYWGHSFLYENMLYYIVDMELFAINFTDLKSPPRKVSTGKLARKEYGSMRLYHHLTGHIAVAEYDSGVDIYRFPSLEVIAELKRNQEVKLQVARFAKGNVLYETRENLLAAFNIEEKKTVWSLGMGERKAKYLGISLGTFQNTINNCELNPQDSLLYVTTMFGDLYTIEPKAGKVERHVEQFKGSGNNAGLLTCLYFVDMNGDGRMELVAPSVDNNIYCLDTRNLSIQWEYDTGNENQMPLAFHDINGDGIPEVFGVSDYDLKLSIIDGAKGTLVREFGLPKDVKKFDQNYVELADFEGNGKLELITRSSWRKIRFLELR